MSNCIVFLQQFQGNNPLSIIYKFSAGTHWFVSELIQQGSIGTVFRAEKRTAQLSAHLR